MVNTIVVKAEKLIRSGQVSAALEILQAAAESGDTEAKFCLGMLYYRGLIVPPDLDISWQWLEEADVDGHIKAPFYLGKLCANAGSHEIAMEWYEKSAEKGFHAALARIGYSYLNGEGVPRSRDKAYEFFCKAKAVGNFSGAGQRARMLVLGHKGFFGIFRGLYQIFPFLLSIIIFSWTNSRKEMEEKFLA